MNAPSKGILIRYIEKNEQNVFSINKDPVVLITELDSLIPDTEMYVISLLIHNLGNLFMQSVFSCSSKISPSFSNGLQGPSVSALPISSTSLQASEMQ